MARIVDCPCGHVLTGKDRAELFALAKQYVRESHPDSARTEEEIREVVSTMAREV